MCFGISVRSYKPRLKASRDKRSRACCVERSFAHMYETGALRRTHLRRHDNIIKRLMIHAGAFNLGLVMRKLSACGTPRGLQSRADFAVHPVNPADRSLLTSPDVSYELNI